jgi:glutamine cyclotransferase
MKLRYIVISLFVLAVLSIGAYSITKSSLLRVTDDVSLEKIEDCQTIYWSETQPVYDTCRTYYEGTGCDDEPFNTSCSVRQLSRDYTCQTGEEIVEKSKEICSEKDMEFTIDKIIEQEKYRLSYGEWGKCSHITEDQTVVVTCDSRYDGNGDGICSSGESCMQFRITKDGTQRLMKNSRNDFVESDKTFFLKKLAMVEVTE